MTYSIQELAALSGVTTRTLRWYDKIGLLHPEGRLPNGYRCYGPAEVDRLQQILFYRALGVELVQIGRLLDDPAFDRLEALRSHLAALQSEQERIASLIHTVEHTIRAAEGKESIMDKEKFEAFKRHAVAENEERYGKELRETYGEAEVAEANAHMMGMTEEQWRLWKELEELILTKLTDAVRAGADPAGETGKEIAQLHKRWLSLSQKTYSAKKHRGIVMLYTADERFAAYYDREVSGCAAFLQNAVLHWIQE